MSGLLYSCHEMRHVTLKIKGIILESQTMQVWSMEIT